MNKPIELITVFKKKSKKHSIQVSEIKKNTDEIYSFLNKDLSIAEKDRFAQIKSLKRKNEWLTVRLMLKELLGKYSEIFYTVKGKPYLKSDYYISISHTKNLAAVIISKFKNPGIDIEILSDRIYNIANKFMYDYEIEYYKSIEKKKFIYMNWSAKETLFKIYEKGELDFKENLKIHPTKIKKTGKINSEITKGDFSKKIKLQYKFLNNVEYILIWYKGSSSTF